MIPKILFVDDDANILSALQRQFRKQYRVDTAQGGEQGLEVVSHKGPFAVIISDFSMPGMNGVEFLARVRDLAPDSVRMMLTGHADLHTAMEAVNEGHIFRFLTKPCPPEVMGKALESGVNQYRLVHAEKELLEQTLSGSIKVLTQILSLLNPEAFGRASRITRYVREVALALKLPQVWQAETAAMLSQIGCIMVRPETLAKLYGGQALNDEEVQLLNFHPLIAADLLKHIPRLEQVREIITYQDKRFDGGGIPRDTRQGEAIPLGARILKVVLDLDALEASGMSKSNAIAQLKQRSGWYDPDILAVLEAVLWIEARYEVRQVPSQGLVDGMILDDDVYTRDGTLLVSKGQEITYLLRKRLHAFAETIGLKEPLRVLVPLAEKTRSQEEKS